LPGELLIHRVSDGFVLPLEIHAQVFLEEDTDLDPIARSDRRVPGGEEVGSAQIALASEQIPRARIAHRGDLRALLRADTDLRRAQ
jgi:hypothetical protein